MLLRYRMITLGAGALLAFAAQAASPSPTVLHAVRFDVSQPMRDIIRDLPPNYGAENEGTVIPNIFIKPQSPANVWTVPDYSGVQRAPTGTPAPALGLAFNAIGNPTACGGCIPPDTNGDVSDVHYIQWVNSKWAVYDKSTGAVVQAPTAGNSFFAGFGGKCQTTNSGDPIALWDSQAKRWVMSQFVTSAPFAQCVAVSTTSDPLGTYYRYEFNWPNFGDYPHMGIWTEENHRQDAYLLTTHEFQTSPQAFLGAALIAMERDKMLVGDPTAAMVRFPGFDAYGVQAIHLSGLKEAPGGTCPTFVHFDFSASNYRFWDMCLDWTTPANSTISAPNTVDSSTFFPYFDSIAQLGTTAVLDSFGSNTMYRATARAFGKDAPTRVSLVINHVVQGSSLNAGVKWLHFNLEPAVEPVGVTDRIFGDGYEGTPLPTIVPQTVMTKTLVDEGTYAIADGQNRWMGGIAMDANQNIGLGFSKSSATINPQIMYTARKATDAPGTMRDEQTCTAGIANGSQTDAAGRWGDYSSMSVDPNDQCTFYFTTEYYATSSARNFSTRVCTFKFPDCGTPDFLLVNETPKRVEVCTATAGGIDPSWTVRAGVLNGFTGPVSLTAVGIPGGTSASFSANPIAAPGSSVMTLVGGASVTAGEYGFSVDGVSGPLTRSASMSLGVSTAAAGAPSLTSPANNATGIKILPTLSWAAVAGALDYTVQVATDVGFTNIVASATVTTTSWKVSTALNQSTQYFWRVTPNNYCGAGATSAVFGFTTGVIGQCPSGTALTPLFSDNFQSGTNGWTTVGTGAATWGQIAAPANTGLSTTVWGIVNNATTSDRGLVSPTINIPGSAAEVFLTYETYHSFETDGPTGCWDNGTIDIKSGAGAFTYVENSRLFTDPYDGLVSAGEANAGVLGWCQAPSPVPTSPKVSVVDLEGYAGQSVQLRFRAVSDSNTTAPVPNGFYIDNLKVETCQPTP